MNNKRSRVTITGGAGMIGSYLVETLVAEGRDVIVVDDLSRGQISNLKAVADQIELRVGDLEDPAFARTALADSDTVYHLASRAFGVGYGQGRHLEILHHNEQVTNNLLWALAAHPPRRLLVTSSSCVYPDSGPDTIPELPVFTGEPEHVNRGYGWAKRFLEEKASLFAAETETPVTIVRPFNIYGERYNWAGEHSQAIPMLIKRILDGNNPVVVWGSGKQRRSYIHAADCARMMHALVEIGVSDAPVNLGTRMTIAMLDLVERISAVAGLTPRIETDPSKPEGRFSKSANTTRFDTLLPEFRFAVSLDEGLQRMTGWYGETDFSPEAKHVG